MEIDGKKVASTGTTALSIVGTVLGGTALAGVLGGNGGSPKGTTSSQLNTELIKQNQHIENKLDEQTNMLLEKLLSELKIIEEQNVKIIKLLGGGIK